ncbi:hypothetical protein CARUB_v10011193mg [Capsella rubella]|uniref:Uncharacterized protein n=1 Tax=Capsella rubella TaxID=81985 RepID=R0IK18_9BRAS|nr:uncharacterized protein LOC17898500 [Capsella rubella]EOA38845.1 hypothetical protein CARUB_v10011193mg [Capsella rubella]
MATERSSSIILLSVLVLALVFSPTLPCQAARVHLDVEGHWLRRPPPPPIRFCPACACCAPAPKGSCCPCRCTNINP